MKPTAATLPALFSVLLSILALAGPFGQIAIAADVPQARLDSLHAELVRKCSTSASSSLPQFIAPKDYPATCECFARESIAELRRTELINNDVDSPANAAVMKDVGKNAAGVCLQQPLHDLIERAARVACQSRTGPTSAAFKELPAERLVPACECVAMSLTHSVDLRALIDIGNPDTVKSRLKDRQEEIVEACLQQ